MARDEVSFAQLADLIEKDTVLAGNVLRLVNSALYSFHGTVNSVRHAVAILGLNKLRNVAMSMSISRIWTHVKTPPGWSMARFDLHSVATAVLTDQLSQHVAVPYPEGGFVAGLLHDVGKLLIAISLPEEYGRILEEMEAGGRSAFECEPELIGASHAEFTGAVLAKWNLPMPIQLAGTFHHTPDLAAGGELHLAHLVRAADQLACELGHAIMDRQPSNDVSPNHLIELGADHHLPEILEHFQVEFETLKAYF